MPSSPVFPDKLRRAQHAIERYGKLKVLDQFRWYEQAKVWAQRIELTMSPGSVEFPERTCWYALCPEEYPYGDVRIVPAKEEGLQLTQPHQALIGEYEKLAVPWKRGHPCLSGEFDSIVRGHVREEPRGEDRLAWHLERFLDWADQAGKKQLLAKGARFELPALSDFELEKQVVFTKESSETFAAWSKVQVREGLLQFHWVDEIIVIDNFQDPGRTSLVKYEWNPALKPAPYSGAATGLWFKLPEVPVIGAWQSPRTFIELRLALAKYGIDLVHLYRRVVPTLAKEDAFLIALGFPIPRKVGSEPVQYHWWFLRVPHLSEFMKRGFRSQSQRALYAEALNSLLSSHNSVGWLTTRNFDRHRLQSRGAFSSELCKSKVLIIGVGALGSVLAEMFVRGGCESLDIVDSDKFDIGNLARHTLTVQDVAKEKVDRLASRLNGINPLAFVTPHAKTFDALKDVNGKYDVIIDATASDDVVCQLERTVPAEGGRIISMSLGFEANRLYLFSAQKWSAEQFFCAFRAELAEDVVRIRESAPDESLGCWHYAFPARVERVWALVAMAIGEIEEMLKIQPSVLRKTISLSAKNNSVTGIESSHVRVD